jgi:hypothetical protein
MSRHVVTAIATVSRKPSFSREISGEQISHGLHGTVGD